MRDKGSVRTPIFLDPQTHARLQVLATANGRSLIEEARSAIEAWVTHNEAQITSHIDERRTQLEAEYKAQLAVLDSL
jgi:hypothetical protein